MGSITLRLGLILLGVVLLTACGGRANRQPQWASLATRANPVVSANGTPSATDIPILPVRLDCVPGRGTCSELVIQGDAHYALPGGRPGPFSGYADPSIRKDPSSSTLWLSYSWPNRHSGDGIRAPGIDIHLARSTDGGNSWQFVSALWPSTLMPNPANPAQVGFLENEASNLLPVMEGNTVTWYAVRVNYLMPNQGGANAHLLNSFHLRVFKAASPEALTDAPYAVLGSNLTAPQWQVTQNLQKLSPELSAVNFWNEPALYFADGRLYLVVVAFVYDNRGAVMSKDNVYVFSTDPTGAPNTWTWKYNGQLVGAKESVELGGQRLSQVDVARGTDGKLLLIASPDDWNAARRDYNHKGCVVLGIKSLDAPALERDADGKLKIHAVITASDSNELGSAASSYDPGSSTGILFTRRNKSDTEFTMSIWKTGIKP